VLVATPVQSATTPSMAWRESQLTHKPLIIPLTGWLVRTPSMLSARLKRIHCLFLRLCVTSKQYKVNRQITRLTLLEAKRHLLTSRHLGSRVSKSRTGTPRYSLSCLATHTPIIRQLKSIGKSEMDLLRLPTLILLWLRMVRSPTTGYLVLTLLKPKRLSRTKLWMLSGFLARNFKTKLIAINCETSGSQFQLEISQDGGSSAFQLTNPSASVGWMSSCMYR